MTETKETPVKEAPLPEVKITMDLRRFNQAEQQVNKALEALGKIEIKDAESLQLAVDVLSSAKKVENLIETKRKELVGPYNAEVTRINKFAKDLTAKLPPEIEAGKKKVLEYQAEQNKKAQEKIFEDRVAYMESLGYVWSENTDDIFMREGCLYVHSSELKTNEEAWINLVNRIQTEINTHTQEKAAKAIEEAELIGAFGSDAEKKELEESLLQTAGEMVYLIAPMRTAPPSGRVGTGFIGGSTSKLWKFSIDDATKIPAQYLIVDETKIRQAIKEGVRIIPGIKIYQEESLRINSKSL